MSSVKLGKRKSKSNGVGEEITKAVHREQNGEIAEEQSDEQKHSEFSLKNFSMSKKTRKILKERGIKALFPIQAGTFNYIIEQQDLIGRDRTGTGKTIAYSLPPLEYLRNEGVLQENRRGQGPLIFVIVPTRELAIQVTNEIESLKHEKDEYRVLRVYGQTDMNEQRQALREGVDILVGTPGRVLDLINRGAISFKCLRVFILDEADEMLNMGFQEDVEKIQNFILEHLGNQNRERLQTLLFSATLPKWVMQIASKFLKPGYVTVDLIKGSNNQTATNVEHLAINCPYFSRIGAIGDVVQCYGGQHCRTIIFAETKKDVNQIMLQSKIKQEANVLHGDIPQKQREVTFKSFKEGKSKVLIATNVAARGLDIPEVDLIIQLDPPKDVETYIHRAGRTARAGRTGVCITFYGRNQIDYLERIERIAKIKFKKISAPQPTDIIKANSRDIAISLKKVPTTILPLFKETVQQLIDEMGHEEALARALGYISGHTENIKQRSLLCAIEGFVTYIIKTDVEFRSLAYIWNYLNKNVEQSVVDGIKGMKALADYKGAIFDVAEQHNEVFEELAKQTSENPKGYLVEKATELPDTAGYGNNSNAPVTTSSNGAGYKAAPPNAQKYKVFVGGLPYNIQESNIESFFSNNQVETIYTNMLRDRETQEFKGCAFVSFENQQQMEKALKLDGTNFQGKSLRINPADSKPGRR